VIYILDPNFYRVGAVRNVVEGVAKEEINGEYSLKFSAVLDSQLFDLAVKYPLFEYRGQYYDVFTYEYTRQNGVYTIKFDCDHVSYRLNQFDLIGGRTTYYPYENENGKGEISTTYNGKGNVWSLGGVMGESLNKAISKIPGIDMENPRIEYEDLVLSGSYRDVLNRILAPAHSPDFTVGTVENTAYILDPLVIREVVTCKFLLSTLLERMEAEAYYDNFQVSLLEKRGSQVPIQLLTDKHIHTLKKTMTATDGVDIRYGGYTVTDILSTGPVKKYEPSYDCDLIDIPVGYFELGDRVYIYDNYLKVGESLRVMSMEINVITGCISNVVLSNLVKGMDASMRNTYTTLPAGLPTPRASKPPGKYFVGFTVMLTPPPEYDTMQIFWTTKKTANVNEYTEFTGIPIDVSQTVTLYAYGIAGSEFTKVVEFAYTVDSVKVSESIPETFEGVSDSVLAVLNTSANTDVTEDISESIPEELNITATVTLIY
jgi:hypothetical protein